MTIYDISKKSGVSIATVSRVINGKKGVSEKTRARVLSVMNEKGYTPNAYARGLGLNSIRTVGIMVMDVADIYLASAVSTIERELRARGYDSLLCCTGSNLENKKQCLRVLLSKRVDAIILVGSHFISEDTSYIELAACQAPVILINGYIKAPHVYCVLCDDFGCMRDAGAALVASGSRDIIYLYNTSTYSGKQKLEGLQYGVTQAGAAFGSDHIFHVPRGGMDETAACVNELIAGGKAFDAVVASDDALAVAAVKALAAYKKSVPQDVQVVGFNNSILARCCEPELTSIDSRVEALCMNAAATMFGVMEGKDFPDRTLISGELVRRGTTRF